MANPELTLERFYLKDLSFESPRSPQVFAQPWKPKVHVDLNSRTSTLEEDRYEVALTITVHTRNDEEETGYIVEVQYGGVFRIAGLEEAQLKRVLSTLCPNSLFPYIRETIDSVVVRGGFPALCLAPINFDALYDRAQQENADGPAMGQQDKPPVEH